MRFTTFVAALVVCSAPLVAQSQGGGSLRLSSTDVRANSRVPDRHVFNGMGCTGANVSPALSWSGAPSGTKSFAVTVYDPDAPTGSGWWHWLIYNIPASANGLPADAGNPEKNVAPAGSVQGNTDFGARGYGGPCPPPGDKPHRYVFTVFALKTEKVEVPANATAAMVGFNLNANVLAKDSLVATYGR